MSSPTVVLVTGANSGIGYEIVKSFYEAPKSYHIIMTSRSLENGTKAMEKIKSEVPSSSNTLQVVQMDLTSDESINAAFATVQSTNQRIDALINNAGTHLPHPPLFTPRNTLTVFFFFLTRRHL